MPKVTFNNKETSFYSEIKRSVDEYFRAHHLKKTGNAGLYIKTGLLVPASLLVFCSFLVVHDRLAVTAGLGSLLGFLLAAVGFNIMHDACHGSYSERRWVNNVMSYSLNALGGNAFLWKFKHNILHHTYPNVDGMDDDIEKSPVIRHCATQKWHPAHQFQHIYIVLVYAITSFVWVFIMDFSKYFTKKVVNTPLQRMNVREHILFWASKIGYCLVYIAIPVYFAGWRQWAVWFTCFHVVMGFTLAIVFQLAHVVEDTFFEFAGPVDPVKIECEWAIHQVKATANFATGNKTLSWLVGGLNFQIEHHLFPRISHVHYPALSKIVKQACLRHNMNYNEFATFRAAVVSHFKTMRRLGKGIRIPQ